MAATNGFRPYAGMLALLLWSSGACSLLVDTTDFARGSVGDAAVEEAAAEDASAGAATDANAALATSCRALRDARGAAVGNGTYTLGAPDGGTFQTYCDMESFDGGWTLVTPSMIVENRRVQDAVPTAMARVAVKENTDARGGFGVVVQATAGNCGKDVGGPPAWHYFLIGELDGWSQIMATYQFSGGISCWTLFGNMSDDVGRNANVFQFDMSVDIMNPQQNMGRSSVGAPRLFDGTSNYCAETARNFWSEDYASDPRSARVVQRRLSKSSPAGIAVTVDCISGIGGGWTISDIYVR